MDLTDALRDAVISGRDHRIILKDGRQLTGLIVRNTERDYRIYHARLPATTPLGWQEGDVLDPASIERVEPL